MPRIDLSSVDPVREGLAVGAGTALLTLIAGKALRLNRWWLYAAATGTVCGLATGVLLKKQRVQPIRVKPKVKEVIPPPLETVEEEWDDERLQLDIRRAMEQSKRPTVPPLTRDPSPEASAFKSVSEVHRDPKFTHATTIRRRNDAPYWYETVKGVRAKWLENPTDEVRRLEKSLGTAKWKRMGQALNWSTVAYESSENKKKMVMGRTWELREALKETHCVLTHAQSTDWLGLVYLLDFLGQLGLDDFGGKPPLAHYMRYPLEQPSDDVSTYVDDLNMATDTRFDHKKNKELLSADAYLFNAQAGESTWYFLSNNWSMCVRKNCKAVHDAALSILKDWCRRATVDAEKGGISLDRIAWKVQNLGTRMKRAAECGSVWAIAIPKADLLDPNQQFLYRSHPYGKVCKCHPKEEDLNILTAMQLDVCANSEKCGSGARTMGIEYPIPQYRLLTSRLKPTSDQPLFMMTPLSRQQRKKAKGEIESAVMPLLELALTTLDR